ncbi:MAG: DUF4189 domain-containing protein [Pseudomonadota bacterium]|nr:DUF4189 domain-containing protein [Pseudomonadota bacterium]
MRTTIFKAVLVASSLASCTLTVAQPNNPWLADGFNKQVEANRAARNAAQMQEQQRRAQAEWQARENAIQAQIAKYRATPYYGTLITQGNTLDAIWGGGGNITPEIADKKAFSACKETGCRIIARVSNGCMMISRPVNSTHNSQWMVAYDSDPQNAISKAIAICEQKYGQGQCGVGENLGTPHRAYCSGYDYSAYDQK